MLRRFNAIAEHCKETHIVVANTMSRAPLKNVNLKSKMRSTFMLIELIHTSGDQRLRGLCHIFVIVLASYVSQ